MHRDTTIGVTVVVKYKTDRVGYGPLAFAIVVSVPYNYIHR